MKYKDNDIYLYISLTFNKNECKKWEESLKNVPSRQADIWKQKPNSSCDSLVNAEVLFNVTLCHQQENWIPQC